MPSGAKKRKAAKRKKELGAIQPDSPTNIPQGNGGREGEGLNRHDQDGRESETGEFGSPTSQENNPFVTEEEGGEYKEKKGDLPVTQEPMESSENGSKEHGEPGVLQEQNTSTERMEEDVLSTPPTPVEAVPDVQPEQLIVHHDQSQEISQPVETPVEAGLEKVSVELDPSDLSQQEGSASVSKEVVQDSDALVETLERFVSISEEPTPVSDVSIENLEGSAAAETSSERKEEKAVPLEEAVSRLVERGPVNESREIGEPTQAVLPPHAARRASWMSCCGLFDVLTGSQR